MNLVHRFRAAWAGALERPALIPPSGPAIPYGALDDLSARFARALDARGVQPGHRVVVQVEKTLGAVALYLAVLRRGAVFVPLDPASTAREVAQSVQSAEPRILVCRPDARPAHADVALPAHVIELGDGADGGLWAEAIAADPLVEVIERQPDDLAALVYTSGTTGRPKGAMLSHHNLWHNAATLHRDWGFTSADVLIHALPIFHVHGLFVALHTSWLNATPVRFLPRFSAEAVRALLPHGTVLMGVPTFYARLAALPGFGAHDCAEMRLFISGSAPLTAVASDAWHALTGHRILERYGMSEAGMITSNPLTGERIAGTVGYPLSGTELRIAGPDGRARAPGVVGGIEIRGPSVFRGYWRMPEQTAAAFRADGFFVTGDLGHQAEDGRVTVAGRAKDLVISGGHNLYPREIEQVLDAVPGVVESAVVGVPDADLGEIAIAVLVAADGPVERTILDATLAESLARYKHPRRFHWVEALPRNAMGKVQKSALRSRFG